MKRNGIGIFSTCTGIRELEKALVSVKELGLEVVRIQSRHLPEGRTATFANTL